MPENPPDNFSSENTPEKHPANSSPENLPSAKTRVAFAAPLLAFCLLAVLLWAGLGLDAGKIPSPLVGKPLPELRLPLLDAPGEVWRTADMRGRVWLLNVWASWCAGCRNEHLFVQRLAGEGAEIVGLNYKDAAADARRWLAEFGDPYAATPADDGAAGLELGVYGVPETFVIDAAGVLRYKHIGELREADLAETIRPLLVRLRAEAAAEKNEK